LKQEEVMKSKIKVKDCRLPVKMRLAQTSKINVTELQTLAQKDVRGLLKNENYYKCQMVNNNNYAHCGPIHVLYRDVAGKLIGGETTYAINDEIEIAAKVHLAIAEAMCSCLKERGLI